MIESHKRSLVKSVSWRFFGLIFTTLMGWMITGSAKAGLTLGLADFIVKIGTFYAHERFWQKVKWGRVDADVADVGGGI
jgi:uncharacterized membrane protein